MKQFLSIAVLAAAMAWGGVASAALCVPAPGTCGCEDVPCAGGPVVCFETKAPTGGFVLNGIVDQFGTHNVVGGYCKRLCAPIKPANIFGTHSVMYQVKDITDPPLPRPSLKVQTAMGTFTGIPGPMRFLQTDAEKSIPPAAPAALVPNGLRTCYTFSKPHTHTDVDFETQFGPITNASVQETALLCLPAKAGVLQSTDVKLCFEMNINGPNARVNLNAPFGPPFADVDHTDNWCIDAKLL